MNFKPSLKKAFVAILALAACVLPSEAAVVYLKDGTQVRGTVVGATARDVDLFTSHGTLHFSTDEIVRIDYSDNETKPAPTVPAAPEEDAPPPARRRVSTSDAEELPQEFSLDLGLVSPITKADFTAGGGTSVNNGSTGLHVGGQYLFRTTPRASWGFGLEYSGRGASESSGLVTGTDLNVYGGSLAMLGLFKYSLSNRGNVRPYMTLGLGLNRTSMIAETTPQFGFVWSDTKTDETRRLVDDANWGLATTARLGLEFGANAPTFFSLELGWTGIYNSDLHPTPFGRDQGLDSVTGHLRQLHFVGRWGWRF